MTSCWLIYQDDYRDDYTAETPLAVFTDRDIAEQQLPAYEDAQLRELPLDVIKTITLPEDKSIFRVFRMVPRTEVRDRPIYATQHLGYDEITWNIYRQAQYGNAVRLGGWHNRTASPELPLPSDATPENPYQVAACYVIAEDEEQAIKDAVKRNGKQTVVQERIVEYTW